MEVKEMTIVELEERKGQIAIEIDNDGADLDAIEQELRAINEELEIRKANESKKVELRNQIANEKVKTTTIKEFGKESENMEERITVNSPEYRSAWVKFIKKEEMNEEEKRALQEARAFSSSSTYAVPQSIADNVVEIVKKKAALLPEIELYNAVGSIRVPYESVVSDAYEHTENASITASSDALLYIDLAGAEIVKITEVSKNALRLSAPAFENWLINQIARMLGDKIDSLISAQLAAGTWTADTNEIVNTAGLSYKNLCDLIALTPAAFDDGAKFYCNKSVLWGIRALTDSNKRPVFDPVEKTLLGYPVVVDDYISKNNGLLYFGNAQVAIKGVLGNVEIDSNELGSGWDKAMVSFRGYTTFEAKKIGTTVIARFVTTE